MKVFELRKLLDEAGPEMAEKEVIMFVPDGMGRRVWKTTRAHGSEAANEFRIQVSPYSVVQPEKQEGKHVAPRS